MSLTLENLQDILSDMIEIDDSVTDTRLTQFINMSGRDIWNRYAWPERHAMLNTSTIAPYSTGTATFTVASTSVTGTGTTWTSTLANGSTSKIARAYDQQWYTATWVSPTALTIAPAYVEATGTDVTYVLYNDLIALTGAESIINVMIGDASRGEVLRPVARVRQDEMSYLPRVTGVPTQYAFDTPSTTTNKIRLWPVPDAAYSVRITYLSRWTDLSGASDTPVLEESRADLLILGALRYAYLLSYEVQKAEIARDRFERELARAWGMTSRRRPMVHVMRRFDAVHGAGSPLTLPFADAP